MDVTSSKNGRILCGLKDSSPPLERWGYCNYFEIPLIPVAKGGLNPDVA
jgi:hypothetical protein